MAFADFSTNNFQLTAFGNAQISTAQKKYGDGSALFDGTGDYIKIDNPSANLINWFDSDFTIEAWVYLISAPSNTPSSSSPLIGNADIFSSTEWWAFGPTNSLSIKFKYWSGAENGLETSASVITTGQWYHLAFVKYGTKLSIYVDGVERATQTLSVTPLISDSYPLAIGSFCNASFNGYIDDLRITKGVARYTANFTPPQQQLPTTTDPNYSNVVLLMPMNLGPFTDSSTNNFQLTAAGNADLSTVVKKYGTASALFDGNGDYLSLPGSDAFNFYNTNFTIEGWIYSAANQTGGGVISTRLGGVYSPWELQIGFPNTNRISLLIQSGAGSWYNNAFYGTTVLPTNQWVHIAWVCQSGNHTVYVNGVADSSLTNLNAPILQSFAQPSNVYIGKGGDGDFNGYIDDLRITKGIARYTANFTPPQQQLPVLSDPYQDNVSLLLHMDQNQFVDASLNNFTITPFGNARSSTQVVKYGDTAAYFDGTGDYLEVLSNDAFNFGTGSFTIEAWIYLNSTPSDYFISSTNGSGGLFFGFRNNTDIGWGRSAVAWDYSAPSSITTGQWYHVAISRNGTDMRLFVNGSQAGTTQTNSTSYNLGTGNLAVGAQNNNYFLNGYIDDLRITKGVARYTTTFTPPSAQLPTFTDPDFANVSLLLQTNRPFTDSSSNNFTLSAFGDAQISTSVKKFGSGAGYFDGNGDCIRLNGGNTFAFGTGDFTIEFWVYVSDWTSRNIYESRGLGEEGNRVTIYVNNNTFIFYNAGNQITSNSKNTNQWYHVAVCRASGTTRMFIDGVQEGSNYTDSTDYGIGVNRPLIGAYEEVRADGYFNGYIDELRVTKGVARYTSNFVPHTAPFVNPPPIPSGYLAFWKLGDLTDSSANGNTLTNNGSVQFVAGKVGNCAQFTGSNSVYLQDSSLTPTFNPSEAFTVSLWIYPRSFTNYQSFIGGPVGTLNIHLDNAGTLYCNNAQAGDAQVTSGLQLSAWQHIVFTVGSNRSKVWINGVNQVDKVKGVTYNSTTNLTLGNYTGGLNFPYDGLLDMVGLWNRELTQSEIDILYNSGNGREP